MVSDLRYVIYGAGAIGGTIGARLALAGKSVTCIARGAHAQAMAERGLRLRAPGEDLRVEMPVVTHPREIGHISSPDVVILLCMKSQHTEGALNDLVAAGAQNPHVLCVQNGVANERLTQSYFPQTYATVVNLPAMHLTPGEVVTHAQGHGGILDTGCFPTGTNSSCDAVTADLRAAGFSAYSDARVMRQKYAKLLLNLANVLQAGLRPDVDITDIGRRLRREALACYAAAGIDCASKEEVSQRQRGVYKMGVVAGVERTAGSSWQSVARGTGDIETAYLNGEISALGQQTGVPTPVNDACLKMAEQLIKDAQPQAYSLADFEAWVTG